MGVRPFRPGRAAGALQEKNGGISAPFLSQSAKKRTETRLTAPVPVRILETEGPPEDGWPKDDYLINEKQPLGRHPGGYFFLENHSRKIAVIPTRTSEYWNSEE